MKTFRLLLVAIAVATLLVPAQAMSAQSDYPLRTHWYQDGPLAQSTPDHERVRCWSTAHAQILFYHQLRPTGRVRYACSPGYRVDVDLEQYRFDWNQLPDAITAKTQTAGVEGGDGES
jgi:Peptidase C10 family